MSDYEMNPYYHPEKSGAAMIGTLEEPDLSYEFNTFLVLRELATGNVYYASDSGCSCPSPFENHEFPHSFEHAADAKSLKNAALSWGKNYEGKSFVDYHELMRKAFP